MDKNKLQSYRIREEGFLGHITVKATRVDLKEEGIVFYMGDEIIAIYPLGTVVELIY